MADLIDAAPVAMRPGASTPEELEVLLEDALLLGDALALGALFEDCAVLLAGKQQSARGAQPIAQLALATWPHDQPYLADTRTVVQARDTALVLTGQSINILRRGTDGAWRYIIVYHTTGE